MKIDFCLPVKNEEAILESNALKLERFLKEAGFKFDWKIIIIVNGSNDKSAEIAKKLQNISNHCVFEAMILEKGGKGLALKEYFKSTSADAFVFMDIDLAVSLDNISLLLDPFINNNADLVMGSRLLKGSNTSRSWWRELTSRIYNQLSRLILRHNYRDLQCGFKIIKKHVFDNVKPFLKDDNWFFDTELIIISHRQGAKIVEIPVDWQESRYEKRKSKIRAIPDAWSFIKNLYLFRRRLSKLKIYRGNV